jgi:hypothetical protein
LVEHVTENHGVPSSILGFGTFADKKQLGYCGRFGHKQVIFAEVAQR